MNPHLLITSFVLFIFLDTTLFSQWRSSHLRTHWVFSQMNDFISDPFFSLLCSQLIFFFFLNLEWSPHSSPSTEIVLLLKVTLTSYLVWEVLQTLLAGLVMWHSQQYLGISFVFVIHQPDCRLSRERIQGLPKWHTLGFLSLCCLI